MAPYRTEPSLELVDVRRCNPFDNFDNDGEEFVSNDRNKG